MRNNQGIVISTQTYKEIFKSALVYLQGNRNGISREFDKNTVLTVVEIGDEMTIFLFSHFFLAPQKD